MKSPGGADFILITSGSPEVLYVETVHPDLDMPRAPGAPRLSLERLIYRFAQYPGVLIGRYRSLKTVVHIDWVFESMRQMRRIEHGPWEIK